MQSDSFWNPKEIHASDSHWLLRPFTTQRDLNQRPRHLWVQWAEAMHCGLGSGRTAGWCVHVAAMLETSRLACERVKWEAAVSLGRKHNSVYLFQAISVIWTRFYLQME